MVAGGVNENAAVVPRARLDAVGLGDGAEAFELAVADEDGVFGQQGHRCHVGGPHHVPAFGDACRSENSAMFLYACYFPWYNLLVV